MRQARLEAARCRYQLEQAHGELAGLRQQVAALAAAQAQAQAQPGAAACPAAWEDVLQAARLEAADSKFKLQLTELELAKQLDALQELQWQLECVACQLGGVPGGGGGGGGAGPDAAGAGTGAPAAPAPAIDHMLLLGKVEELRAAQLQLAEYKRRLAAAEAAAAAAEARAPAGQPQCARPLAGLAVPAAAVGSTPGRSDGLGACGQELLGSLLGENEQLRARLAEAEVSQGREPALRVTCLV